MLLRLDSRIHLWGKVGKDTKTGGEGGKEEGQAPLRVFPTEYGVHLALFGDSSPSPPHLRWGSPWLLATQAGRRMWPECSAG